MTEYKSQESKQEGLPQAFTALLILRLSVAFNSAPSEVGGGGDLGISTKGRQNTFVVFKQMSSSSTCLKSDIMICLLVRFSV